MKRRKARKRRRIRTRTRIGGKLVTSLERMTRAPTRILRIPRIRAGGF